MPLFKTLAQIAEYVTISNANTGTTLVKQREAEEEYIIPVIGQTLFDGLQSQVDSNTITDAPLLNKVRMALGFLSYYKELPFLHVRITDSGLRNVTTSDIQGAYRYQYEMMRQELEDKGLAALERLYEYMQANKATYTDWASSAAYARLNKNLIKTGIDFTKYYHLHQPNRTFFALQPVMNEVESLFIRPTIGSTYFEALRDIASPSANEAAVIELLKSAIANFTIYKSIAKLSVKVRPEGFTVLLGGSDKSQGEQTATIQQLEDLKNDCYKDGNSYLERAKIYLNTYASETVFADYFSSTYYVNPDDDVIDPNDYNTGIMSF